MTDNPFRRLTTLRAAGADTFDGVIEPTWTIGPKVHGGAMMSVCAAAAAQRLATDPDPVSLTPLAVSASYLAAPDPGAVSVATVVRKRGRRVVTVDTMLSQNGRPSVHCVVTLGTPDSDAPRFETPSPVASMPASPPESASRVDDGHPMAAIVHVARGCELALDAESSHFLNGAEGDAALGLWIRPKDGDASDDLTAALFAIMAGDISPPVTMNRGLFGWAPTVQLTTYLRRQPAPGWLRVRSSSTVIGSTWFEEDHTIVDSTGAVVVQSRQLAMVPLTG